MSSRPVAARGGGAGHSTDERSLDALAARAAHAVGAGVSIAGGYAALLRERCGARSRARRWCRGG